MGRRVDGWTHKLTEKLDKEELSSNARGTLLLYVSVASHG